MFADQFDAFFLDLDKVVYIERRALPNMLIDLGEAGIIVDEEPGETSAEAVARALKRDNKIRSIAESPFIGYTQ